MTDPVSRVSVSSKLRLLLVKRYLELLFVMGVLSIPTAIMFLTGDTTLVSFGSRITLYSLIHWVSDYLVFPGCLLATLFINRSVLRAEPRSLLGEFRLAIRAIITYFLLIFIEYGPLVAAIEGIRRILIADRVLEKGSFYYSKIAFPLGASIMRFVFLFSLPLLVLESFGIMRNVMQSLKLFKMHKASLLPMLGFSLLIMGIGLPESFHMVSRSEYLLLINLASEIVLILFYVLSMDYYILIESTDKFAHDKSLELTPKTPPGSSG
jgi:hypothetical protein